MLTLQVEPWIGNFLPRHNMLHAYGLFKPANVVTSDCETDCCPRNFFLSSPQSLNEQDKRMSKRPLEYRAKHGGMHIPEYTRNNEERSNSRCQSFPFIFKTKIALLRYLSELSLLRSPE